MKDIWKIYFNGDEVKTLTSEQDLLESLSTIPKTLNVSNPIIELENPDGDVLIIGLDKQLIFLNYSDSTMEPPYYTTVNPAINNKDEIEMFEVNNQETEIPLRNCLPREKGEQAILYFYKTSKMSDHIRWEED